MEFMYIDNNTHQESTAVEINNTGAGIKTKEDL